MSVEVPSSGQRPYEFSPEVLQKAEGLTIFSYESAISRRQVGYDLVCAAHYHGQPAFESDEVTRAVFQRYYPRLLEVFEDVHGAIARQTMAVNVMLAVVVTRSGHFEIGEERTTYPFDSPAVHELIFDAERLRDRVVGVLDGDDRFAVLEQIYNAVAIVVGSLDHAAGESDQAAARVALETTIETARDRLAAAEQHFLRVAARQALLRYFVGALLGLAGLAVPLAILGVLSLEHDWPGEFVACLGAGALGALVSVMMRMTNARLSVEHEAPRWMLMLLGGVRSWVGAIFGIAAYVLVVGELVPVIAVPEDDGTAVFFAAGLGFVAGFSERVAQDMLVQSSGLLSRQPDGSPDAT